MGAPLLGLAALQQRLYGGGGRIRWRTADVGRLAKRFGVSAANLATLSRLVPSPAAPASKAVKRSESGAGKRYSFTISTGDVDRYGDTIRQTGWKVANYKRNPVVLFGHDSGVLPIGSAISVNVEGGKLKSTMAFATDEFAARAAAAVDDDTLRGASVGFIPLRWEFATDPSRDLGIDFMEQELVEWSLVPIPANAACLLERVEGTKSAAASRPLTRAEAQAEVARIRARVDAEERARERGYQ